MKTKKGFTLIELLIVIAIIGILAVAFLPTLLAAPAKGRDTARIADMQKIQKVLVNNNLEGNAYPNTGGAIVGTLTCGSGCTGGTWAGLLTSFGGTLPKDPTTSRSYYYVPTPTGYSFGLWAQVEILTNGNANCNTGTPFTITLSTSAAAVGTTVPCYAVLTQ